MPPSLPDVLKVLVFQGGTLAVAAIEAVAPGRLDVVDVSGCFVTELASEWPGWANRSSRDQIGMLSVEDCEALLQQAHLMLLGVPFPKTLPTRAPKLLWAHFGFAGVSNLMGSDWWGLDGPIITSSRGATSALPIAETTVAAALMFAKHLNRAVTETEAHEYGRYAEFAGMTLVAGKTMGIVGLGGIGSHVARLSRALGMRVVATRRSADTRRRDVDGVDELFPAEQLNEMLAEADFVAICAMWTPETEGMIDAKAFAAMKSGAILLNVARGEIVDEGSLVEALRSGHLSGAFLDVWHQQLEGASPIPALQAAPNVVFMPHVSGLSDGSHAYSLDLFLKNLRRLLVGEPLENRVDWSRGY
jgi:phosphoglycerate dehydrogenase-like enzyme